MEIRNGPGLDAETHGNSFSSKAFLNLNLKRNSNEERVIKRAKKNSIKGTGSLWEGEQLITLHNPVVYNY